MRHMKTVLLSRALQIPALRNKRKKDKKTIVFVPVFFFMALDCIKGNYLPILNWLEIFRTFGFLLLFLFETLNWQQWIVVEKEIMHNETNLVKPIRCGWSTSTPSSNVFLHETFFSEMMKKC